jgi:very-short-patch-repair endonuclease
MTFLIVAIFVVLALGAMMSVIKAIGPARRPSLPFRKCDYLFTAAERSFYEVLRSVTQDRLHVFPKVRLVDLVYLPGGTENRQAHMNRVMSKHVDFVLCDLQAVTPVLVIELDDSSHGRDDRRARDEFVDGVLSAAGLPILHVAAKQSYAPKELAELIEAQLQHPPTLASA